MEAEILNTLGRERRTIRELSRLYYGDKATALYRANVVSSAIFRINQKCKYHKLDWFVNGAGRGRGGKTVWRDKQQRGSYAKRK